MRHWWRRNGEPSRRDIADRYLAHLRWDLMHLPPPHIANEYQGTQERELLAILDGRVRMEGAITMIGEKRLRALEPMVDDILRHAIPGDFLEAGAWRGGACIYLRALLDVYGCRTRMVYVCDAFDDGFPKPDGRFPVDNDSQLHHRAYFRTSRAKVQDYFTYYDYWDPQVTLIPGYFRESLPQAPIRRLALLRLDGDLYQSTWDPLEILYERVSPGGYIIADDYHAIRHSQLAVDEFRASRQIAAPLVTTDWASVYWRKED